MMKICDEMQQLRKMLDERNIPWEDDSEDMTHDDFIMWIARTHFEFNDIEYSVINGFGTYGGWHGLNPGIEENENTGLLELMGGDIQCGWLTANDVIMIITGEEKDE